MLLNPRRSLWFDRFPTRPSMAAYQGVLRYQREGENKNKQPDRVRKEMPRPMVQVSSPCFRFYEWSSR
ncbi:hypothetical protein PpBr36_02519 [Pyricularia pennisetigena]|uniref:hypothetical protein n=1 Tax=Pyricularia pennisetigena TaxID=1578925 RepID=UPI00114E5D6F|nr:hypothetical protein PpBr36_02519 [Pyricularia pennisetigena]TLS31491.1 hypothetical protein PpBr36_02519 [Pyricularia pennisetigena]